MGIIPDRGQFRELARTASVIPVYGEILADNDTPVSALAKLGPGPARFLLESVEGGNRIGRYSFVGHGARWIVRAMGPKVELRARDGTVRRLEHSDPLALLEQLLQPFRGAPVPGLPPFFGGAVGYVGFDGLGRPSRVPEDGDGGAPVVPDFDGKALPPDLMFLVADEVLVFDHVRRTLQVVVHAQVEGDVDRAYDEALGRIARVVDLLRRPSGLAPLSATEGAQRALAIRPNMDANRFRTMAQAARDVVRAGDVYQVVLSVRFSAPLNTDPFTMYRLLRSINPSPYMFYLDMDDLQLVGSSPEVMVRLHDGEALLRPIAGTRPRGRTAAEDDALAKGLLADAKERAEHAMLVDLGRGDLGRVCRPGTIRVDEWMSVEKYSHVMHIVSNVRGELAPGRTAFDLFKATFPAGTVSGVPKRKALDLIDRWEQDPRGPYGGAVGYFGFNGTMDSCIAIRTLVVHGGEVHVQAGAGIVADSDPEHEYNEIYAKAKGLLQTLALAQEATS